MCWYDIPNNYISTVNPLYREQHFTLYGSVQYNVLYPQSLHTS